MVRKRLGPGIIALLGLFLVTTLVNGIRPDAEAAPARRLPETGIKPLTWSRVPGEAIRLAVAPDGSLWALTPGPAAGPNKHIIHFVDGKWTTVPGFATDITVAPDGTPYIVTAAGGLYAYSGSAWLPLNNSLFPMSSVMTGSDGHVYLLSKNKGPDGNYAIFTLPKRGVAPVRQPGSAAALVASFDPLRYQLPGIGTVPQNGYYSLLASGAIYHNVDLGQANVSPEPMRVPFTASGIAPIPGGYFLLRAPASAGGSRLFYFDYASATLSAEPYAFASIVAQPAASGTYATELYALDAGHRIWTTPVIPVSPQAPPTEFSLVAIDTYADPYAIVAGSDRALWFTEARNDIVGRISESGDITEYPVDASILDGNGPLYGIAAGTDGALWFTEWYGNAIGRLTTAGSLSTFALPTQDAMPQAIAAGPDGALWFTEFGAHAIGRITTSGKITEYAAPAGAYAVDAITKGPDGAMWFTGQGGIGRIGRITVSGTITEFAVGRIMPASIAAGPDGALWFTEARLPVIGRIATDGQIKQYPVPGHALTSNTAISAGADGAMWFALEENVGPDFGPLQDWIGRITPNGVSVEYPISGSGVSGLALGPDGNIWCSLYQNIGVLKL